MTLKTTTATTKMTNSHIEYDNECNNKLTNSHIEYNNEYDNNKNDKQALIK